ncbi:uncharacterized protein LOC110837893 [Zootermopsis nevadensis]|uniref:uncharacterized protein LOC110837893 n=1 Tax=Zootermopsis nevadensis TaxID=136037 RepID=UPI000B8E29F1|nr:uncharacterized protein LOC110837893 [Zootermopsis nevadensis]
MATTTYLQLSLVFCLLAFCSDCHPQGAQAFPSSKTLAKNRVNVIESRLSEKKSSTVEDRLSGVPKENLQLLQYKGELPLLSANNSNTLSISYPDDWIIDSIFGITIWENDYGDVYISDGGAGENSWAVTWILKPQIAVVYDFNVYVVVKPEYNKTATA